MASKAFLIAILISMVAVPSMATDYTVGDEAGWEVGVDYTEWAAGKKFYVGDTIEFLYKQGSDNVLKVDGPTFQQCVTSNTTGVLTSGKDVILFATPGKKWYISTVDNHCYKGVKLVITVSDSSEAAAPAPTPIPPQTRGSSEASEIFPFKSLGRMLKMILA